MVAQQQSKLSLGNSEEERLRLAHRVEELTAERDLGVRLLRESEERYRSLADHQRELIFRWDSRTIITFANRAYCHFHGRSHADIIGASWLHDLTPEALQLELARYRDVILADPHRLAARTVEYPMTLPDGGRGWFEWSFYPCFDEQGELTEVHSVGREITGRRSLEQELLDSEERWHFAVEGSDLGLWDANLKSGEVYYSSRWKRMLGYADHEIQGRLEEFSRLIHPEDLPRLREVVAEHYASVTELFACEFRMAVKGGGWCWIASRGKVMARDEEGAPIRMLGTHTDITARIENEEMLASRTRELDSAREALEQALRLKDDFLACMSHELRTPLTVIIGQSEILRDEIHGPLNETQQKAVLSVESGGHHLLALINDILDLSKIEAAMLELYPEQVNVEQLCVACLQFVKQQAHAKRLAVSMILDPAAVFFRADSRRVMQLLINLLANAVKFTPEGGEVGLQVTGDQEGGQIRFLVWDTGIGISQADLARLFSPFVQVGSGLNRRHEGTGLGLALVERLVRLHGGGVSVVSEEGRGSRFTVTLPWEGYGSGGSATLPSSGERSPAPEVAALPSDEPLILVVDDSPATVEMMREYLRGCNYRVTDDTGGEEAVALARIGFPALILMDIQMPGMDGLEAIRLIRRLPGSVADVPIIALTALAMQGDRERCLSAGADEYLSKPARMAELNIQIRKLLVPQRGRA